METGSEAQAAVELKDIWKALGPKREQVLAGVNLKIRARAITFLLGPSGSGKSVMLKHIVGLMRPDRGDILVFGESLPAQGGEKLNRIRRRFGVLFQGVALFDNMTIYENIAFPLIAHRRDLRSGEIRERVNQSLISVGLDPAVNAEKFPNQLSGGMQRRVGLGRAIILKPDIILYDEPTTGLDPVNRAMVEDMILDAKERLGLTGFVISHDIGAALGLADEIAFLDQGKIAFLGSPKDFQRSEHTLVRKFFEAEQRHRGGQS